MYLFRTYWAHLVIGFALTLLVTLLILPTFGFVPLVIGGLFTVSLSILIALAFLQLIKQLRQEQILAQSRNCQLAALDEATIVIASELSVERVLQRIVEIACELSGARYGALGVKGADGGLVNLIAAGLTPEERESIGPFPRSHGILGRMLREGRAVRIPNLQAEPTRSGFPPNHPPMYALMGVPVASGHHIVGDLYLADKVDGGDFTGDDERLIVLLAAHAAVAIENATLHNQVQNIAALEERDRIGRELHDGTIQSIYGVSLMLEDVHELIEVDPDLARTRVDESIDSINIIIRDLRSYIMDLRPQVTQGTGLQVGLAQVVEQHRAHTLVEIKLDADPTVSLDVETNWHLLQIAREALSNIAKYAAASSVRVVLSREKSNVILTIEDNGRGFHVASVADKGHGLRNMTDRAIACGGRLDINSSAGTGTSIRVVIPDKELAGE